MGRICPELFRAENISTTVNPDEDWYIIAFLDGARYVDI